MAHLLTGKDKKFLSRCVEQINTSILELSYDDSILGEAFEEMEEVK